MKKISILCATIIFSTLILGACSGITATPEIPMLTEPAQTSAPADQLTLADFNNSSIYCPEAQRSVLLSDGKYEGGSGADYLLVQLLPQAAFGDFNGDGWEDAALLISEYTGGTGTFVSISVMIANDTGYIQLTPIHIDDRPLINSLTVQDGNVVLDAVVHGVADSMADPTKAVVETFSVIGTNLVLTRVDSTISGAYRTISISGPTAGQEVNGTVHLTGSMPIAPFENTLVYRVYDENNTVIGQGPFMVSAADMGAPATFDVEITLPSVSTGAKLRIELQETSMANSSTLCLASVQVVVK
jgi:hypothetical protein